MISRTVYSGIASHRQLRPEAGRPVALAFEECGGRVSTVDGRMPNFYCLVAKSEEGTLIVCCLWLEKIAEKVIDDQ